MNPGPRSDTLGAKAINSAASTAAVHSAAHAAKYDPGASSDDPARGLMDVAVIVVGFNDATWLAPCLQSVMNEIPPECVYFVDNASEDNSAELVTEGFPQVHVTRNSENRGFAGGNNQVLSMLALNGDYRYAFLLNPDTVVPIGLISGLRDFMEEFPGYVAVGPLQTEYLEVDSRSELNRVSRRDLQIGQYHVLRRWLPEFDLKISQDDPVGVLGVYYVQGSAFFARMDLFRDIGFFDELYHAFFEEVDLCRRARWHGHKLGILTWLHIRHASRGAANRSRYRIYYRIRNKYLFVLTDPELPGRTIPLLVFRLLMRDMRLLPNSGSSQDFRVSSFTHALLWLMSHGREIVRGRRWRRAQMAVRGDPVVV